MGKRSERPISRLMGARISNLQENVDELIAKKRIITARLCAKTKKLRQISLATKEDSDRPLFKSKLLSDSKSSTDSFSAELM